MPYGLFGGETPLSSHLINCGNHLDFCVLMKGIV